MTDESANRVWAAIALSLRVETCEAILAGEPVIAANLDGKVLRRALRGKPPPPISEFITVTPEMLDAIAEAGPLRMADDGPS